MRRIRANRAAAVYPIAVAGLLHGVGRDGALLAAAAGDFPTIRVGGQTFALADPINKTLGLSGIDDPRVREAFRLAGLEPPPLAGDVTDKQPVRTASAKPVARKRKTKARFRGSRKGESTAVAL